MLILCVYFCWLCIVGCCGLCLLLGWILYFFVICWFVVGWIVFVCVSCWGWVFCCLLVMVYISFVVGLGCWWMLMSLLGCLLCWLMCGILSNGWGFWWDMCCGFIWLILLGLVCICFFWRIVCVSWLVGCGCWMGILVCVDGLVLILVGLNVGMCRLCLNWCVWFLCSLWMGSLGIVGCCFLSGLCVLCGRSCLMFICWYCFGCLVWCLVYILCWMVLLLVGCLWMICCCVWCGMWYSCWCVWGICFFWLVWFGWLVWWWWW